MAKKRELNKEEVVRKFKELKKSLIKLGNEGLEVSKTLESEFVKGQKLVKSLWDTAVIKKRLEKGLKEMGEIAHKMISRGELKDARLASISKDVASLTRLLKMRNREASSLKKEMKSEFKR